MHLCWGGAFSLWASSMLLETTPSIGPAHKENAPPQHRYRSVGANWCFEAWCKRLLGRLRPMLREMLLDWQRYTAVAVQKRGVEIDAVGGAGNRNRRACARHEPFVDQAQPPRQPYRW